MSSFNSFVKNQIKTKKVRDNKYHFWYVILKSLFSFAGLVSLFMCIYMGGLPELYFIGLISLALGELVFFIDQSWYN